MSNLDIQFQKAVKMVRNAPSENPPSDEIRLEFYAYYKQATQGDVKESAPSRFWIRARAKWDAWNNMKGLSKDKAKQCYILLTKEYMS